MTSVTHTEAIHKPHPYRHCEPHLFASHCEERSDAAIHKPAQSTLPKLPSLSGVKLLAVIGILCCHTGLIGAFDACARMVEILFVLSGFLMAYNHFATTTEYSLATGAQYLKKKLPVFYPIHLFTFLLQALFVAYWAEKPLSYLLTVGTLNLTLQHAWFIDTEFSYNNVSWFLSALVFAYLITPTLAGIVKTHGTNLKSLLKITLIIILIRTLMEALVANRYIRLDLHCNPFIQTLNYTLGYLGGILFIQKTNFNQYIKDKSSSPILSIIQILCITLYLLCCVRFNDAWRVFFVCLIPPMLYFLALENGIIAKILSIKPVQYLSTFTLEIFMLHSFILYKFPTNIEEPITYVKFFTLTLIAALLFKKIEHLLRNNKRG